MLTSLELRNFRLFEYLDLDFNAPRVFLCGSNGQGKTTILEAIFYLSSLRSFRTQKISELITIHQNECVISADSFFFQWKRRLTARIGQKGTRLLSVDRNPVSKASEFAGSFHIVTFMPNDPDIVTGSAAVRRKLLDMFISMLDPDYFRALQIYAAGVRNRNFLLKNKKLDSQVLNSFHTVISQFGAKIVQKREFHLKILSDFTNHVIGVLKPELADLSLKMKFQKDFANPDFFKHKLDSSVERDAATGYTSYGPQWDDFEFIADGKSLRQYGSRGQCRAAAFSLKCAQFDITQQHESSRNNTIVMVDDATGDFDRKTQDAFYQRIAIAKQTFYTFTELPSSSISSNAQIIHISSGNALT